ncbi:MAG: hypothetical protein II628_10075, partial [Lachnospiraceae bacterium]|nr:hypothetical protein [Lachnospiraceae bacterium]
HGLGRQSHHLPDPLPERKLDEDIRYRLIQIMILRAVFHLHALSACGENSFFISVILFLGGFSSLFLFPFLLPGVRAPGRKVRMKRKDAALNRRRPYNLQ